MSRRPCGRLRSGCPGKAMMRGLANLESPTSEFGRAGSVSGPSRGGGYVMTRWTLVAVPMIGLLASAGLDATASATATRGATEGQTPSRYFVYWDENEQEDALVAPGDGHGQLVPPW